MQVCSVYIMSGHFSVALALITIYATLAAGKSEPGLVDIFINQVKCNHNNKYEKYFIDVLHFQQDLQPIIEQRPLLAATEIYIKRK